jgi:hypothetical protein
MNVATHQFTQVKVSSSVSNAHMSGTPPTDNWQYAFWEDKTHLLVWYNGVVNASNASVDRTQAGLYRYDVTTQQLTQVVSLNTLGVATAYSPQKNAPFLLSLRYSSGQLFYQVVEHPFGQQSQVVIYRRSVSGPANQSSRVFQQGSEAWCGTPQSAFVRPGWDVAPDGQQLVVQLVTTTGQGAIQSVSLTDGSTTPLFAQAPATLLSNDVTLAWGPDSQTIVVSSAQLGATTPAGPYSASLANPTAVQQYAPDIMGQVVWRTDGTAFVLETMALAGVTATPNVYVFLTGQPQGRMLLANAHNFAWGN